jgi:hypothetical protein
MIRTSLLTGLTVALVAASSTFAMAETGTANVALAKISAVQMNGSPAPEKDAVCQEKYKGMIGQTISTAYNINTETLMMSATSTIDKTPVPMFTLGLSNSYSFMATDIPTALQPQGITRVLFSLDLKFANPQSTLMTSLDAAYNCVVSSK